MGRWEPDARGRLAKAALELYGTHGFEETTVEEIARRAGLTERTFFRYFSDKREVLFWGASALEEQLTRAVAEAPSGLSAIDATRSALETVGADFRGRRDFSLVRQKVIAANADLRERERIKLASLAVALSQALQRRGVPSSASDLTAELGTAIFRLAFERWVEKKNKRELSEIIGDSFEELQGVVSASHRP